jgi:hypothetical protein
LPAAARKGHVIPQSPYAAFDRRLVLEALPGADSLLDEEVTSQSSGKAIHRIVARKQEHD